LSIKENKPWGDGRAKDITFIVTDDCQLRCHYCYLTKKGTGNAMTFDIAKKAIDLCLNNKTEFMEDSVIWDFIGGEPLLEIQLIDKICDYIKLKTYEMDHVWFGNYRISISTNGLLYDNAYVQKFIKKNINHLSLSISIDGIKEKHDAQRVYPNGRGSYEDVIKVIPHWIQQFGDNVNTKATVASEDLRYIKDSVLHMFDLGIKYVNMNTVFENVWKDGDDEILEEQLILLGNYIIKHKLYNDYNCSFFSEAIGEPLDPLVFNENWCGAGMMLAVYPNGDLYPCVRFAPYSMNSKRIRKIGDCFSGIDKNKLRPFLTLDRTTQSTESCISCPVASGCAWCQGYNLDSADTDTIFQRATYICKMHKARVRANRLFFDKLKEETGVSANV
jgi:uncharacterized protein